MPSEPEKPIEQMLEASAKARRDGFGEDPKMPNPMRARLHEEIARQGREEIGASGQSWIHMFWPRLAVAAAMAIVLIGGPVMWWYGTGSPGHGMVQVAGKRSAAATNVTGAQTIPSPQTADEVQSQAPPNETLAKGAAAAADVAPEVNLADSKPAQIEPAATPMPGESSLGGSNHIVARNGESRLAATKGYISKTQQPVRRDNAAPASVASVPAAAAPSAVTGTAETQSSVAGGIQHFAQQSRGQQFRNNMQRDQPANILNTFQFQQQGNEIRVFDSDGSTYAGKLEPAARLADRLAKARRSYAQKAEADTGTVAGSQTTFRASGYNVSLKKSLVFEGDYTAPAEESQQNLATDTRQQQQKQAPRIVGTATIQGEPPVQVDATAVESPPSPRASP